MNPFIKELLKSKAVESKGPAPQTSRGRRESREAVRTTGFQPSSFQEPANQGTSQILPILLKPLVPASAELTERSQPVALPKLVQPQPSESGLGANTTDGRDPCRVQGKTSKEQFLPKLPAAKPKTSARLMPKRKPSEGGASSLLECSDENFSYLLNSKKLLKGKPAREAVETMDESEVLDTILAHLQQSLQRTPATDPRQATRRLTAAGISAASQKTAGPQKSPKTPSQDKTALYYYYGVKLRESRNKDLVCKHLHILLKLAGQDEDREAISEAVGLVASCHLPEILAILGDYGHSVRKRKSLQKPGFERWMRATLMLCYGYAAVGAKAEDMFPQAELFVAEILFQMQGIDKDEGMKRCFLRSVVMITKALQHCGKEDFCVPHKTELATGIIEVLDEEPLGSCSIQVLHQAIITISCLTAWKPPLDSDIRSSLVCKSVEKVFSLPSLEVTKLRAGSPAHPTQTQDFYQQTVNACNSMLTGLLSESPNTETLKEILLHTNGWIESPKKYERGRAVSSTNYILKFASERSDFAFTQEFSLLGHLVAMLSLRIADSVKDIGMQAAEALYYLHRIIMGQQERDMEKKPKNKKGNIVKWFREDFLVSGPSVFFKNPTKIAKAFGEHLAPSQISELALKAIVHLRHEEVAISRGAGVLLSSFLEECGVDVQDLPTMIKDLYQNLPAITDPVTKEETLKALCNLALKRLNGVLDSLLECSLECNKSIAEMWKALACEPHLRMRLIRPLLKRLKDKESLSDIDQRRHSTSLVPIAATNALCLILSSPEPVDEIQGTFAHLLIALVTQIYMVIGTGRRGSNSSSNAEFPDTPLGSAIQALKNLITCASYGKEYNILGTQGCWDMLATPENFFEGLFQLMRVLFEYNKMHLNVTFKLAYTYLHRPHIKERTIGMACFTELLFHREIGPLYVKQDILDVLREWMGQPCPLMQILSIRGLGYFLQHSFKEKALEPFLSPLLTCALDSDRNVAKESIKTLHNMFRHLDTKDYAPMGLTLIPHLLRYFNDHDSEMRASSIGLFGMMLKGMKDGPKQSLKEDVSKAFVPLLVQLTDPWTRVVSKDAFATCIHYMNWGDMPKDLGELDPNFAPFYVYRTICKYIMQKNREKLPEMAAQMVDSLKSRFTSHREAAAILIGCNAHYMKQDLSTKEIENIYMTLRELQADHEPTVAKTAAEAIEEFLRHCGHRVNPKTIHSTSVRRSSMASETRK
ncbi:maestro heat-like repeat family member 5 [Hemicordylus capensis]|uniref:maestro heat-like repeat family member 5 n=1 Tax=Hemicordylus capensis TaxID=884348 RepID=UPI00230387C7|nr:maestro heat-like repeat family member 5 [Hemicordylus capensis]XP_053121975.1 maestro heat-like repeat family member 5 [Hemicordylus capensis]